MRVLVACEYSGRVRDAFRARGHDAWSCDILPCDADPAFHFTGDCVPVIAEHRWDLIVAHPPCTALAVSGNRWYAGSQAREDAIGWTMALAKLMTDSGARWAIENPVGVLSREWPVAAQSAEADADRCGRGSRAEHLAHGPQRGSREAAQPDVSGHRRRDGRPVGGSMSQYQNELSIAGRRFWRACEREDARKQREAEAGFPP
jgi:hypothetical protein